MFLWTGVTHGSFSNTGKVELTMYLSKFEEESQENILDFLNYFDCNIFFLGSLFNTLISFKIESFLTWRKVKLNLELTFCFIARILGHF